ncbi:hypothetical protein TrRE_jg5637 [Triparma retinervis]|uniref:Uncharacterized protein n=1 Tax=Triparma retinervis TaxID=2557542 RepID=A0A9W7F4K0_9STRA|nr:hypothetical protein TrRE_jg5637 [Triparma retinervis]
MDPGEKASALLIPDSLKTLNAVARIWCVGAGPKQSWLHNAAVKVTLAGIFLSMTFLVNDFRLRGNISFPLQASCMIIQVSTILGWRHARMNLLFENVIKTRWKTMKILEQAGRIDMKVKIDKEILPSIVKDRLLITPFLTGIVIGLVSFFYAGKDTRGQAFAFWLLFVIQDNVDNMSCFAWELTCQLHSLQIELFHDQLSFAFADLAEVTTSEEERRASVVSVGRNGDVEDDGDSGRDSGSRGAGIPRFLSGKELVETTEFFDETFVLSMSIAFVDICKTLTYTSEHMARHVAFDNMCFLVAAGCQGLGMLVHKVTFEALSCVLLLLYFIISSIVIPIGTNAVLRKVRALSWDSYGELISHSLLFKGSEVIEDNSATEYKMICNQAKHLLNMIQTSREGLKFGQIEYSNEIITKILSITFSAGVVILKTADTTPITDIFGGEGGGGLSRGAGNYTQGT